MSGFIHTDFRLSGMTLHITLYQVLHYCLSNRKEILNLLESILRLKDSKRKPYLCTMYKVCYSMVFLFLYMNIVTVTILLLNILLSSTPVSSIRQRIKLCFFFQEILPKMSNSAKKINQTIKKYFRKKNQTLIQSAVQQIIMLQSTRHVFMSSNTGHVCGEVGRYLWRTRLYQKRMQRQVFCNTMLDYPLTRVLEPLPPVQRQASMHICAV